MSDTQTPSLYEWAGGSVAFERLLGLFYDRVKQDAVLAPLFAAMDPQPPSPYARPTTCRNGRYARRRDAGSVG